MLFVIELDCIFPLFLVQPVNYLNIGLIVGLSLAGLALLITVILLIVFRHRLCGGETEY